MDSPLHNTIKTQRITLLHPYLRHRSNHINSNLYHYGGLGQRQLLGNNPVKYVDPYDLFNLTKGKEWNPDVKSYMITDSWTVNINGDY